MTQAITIQIKDDLYQQLKRAAELSHQPVDRIIEQSLAHSLPPLLEEIPPEYQTSVYPLLQMNLADLQQEVKQVYDPQDWEEYETLLAKKKEGLTKQESLRLVELRRAADVLTLRKGYAALLLKRRGYAIPTPSQLPQVA